MSSRAVFVSSQSLCECMSRSVCVTLCLSVALCPSGCVCVGLRGAYVHIPKYQNSKVFAVKLSSFFENLTQLSLVVKNLIEKSKPYSYIQVSRGHSVGDKAIRRIYFLKLLHNYQWGPSGYPKI